MIIETKDLKTIITFHHKTRQRVLERIAPMIEDLTDHGFGSIKLTIKNRGEEGHIEVNKTYKLKD